MDVEQLDNDIRECNSLIEIAQGAVMEAQKILERVLRELEIQYFGVEVTVPDEDAEEENQNGLEVKAEQPASVTPIRVIDMDTGLDLDDEHVCTLKYSFDKMKKTIGDVARLAAEVAGRKFLQDSADSKDDTYYYRLKRGIVGRHPDIIGQLPTCTDDAFDGFILENYPLSFYNEIPTRDLIELESIYKAQFNYEVEKFLVEYSREMMYE